MTYLRIDQARSEPGRWLRREHNGARADEAIEAWGKLPWWVRAWELMRP